MTRVPGMLGKAPATKDKRDIKLRKVVGPQGLKEAPTGFGHWPTVDRLGEEWGMLGNDTVGDCVWAGADHETMLWNAINGRVVSFTAANALSDYSAVTGYDPNDPNTDQGTDMRQAMVYRRKTGVVDARSTRHKIGAFVALDPGDWGQLLEALYAFDLVAIGFEVPRFAMTQFQNGKPWSCSSTNKTIEGGHYTPVVGRPGRSRITVVTWGQRQDMTRCFYETYSDEAYGIVSTEALSAGGVTAEGLDIDKLNAALGAL